MNYEYDHNIRSERLALWFANQEINSKTTSSLHCLAQAASLLWFITFKMRIKLYFLSMHRIWGGTTERTFVKLAYKLLSTREFQDFSLSIKNSGSPIFFFFFLFLSPILIMPGSLLAFWVVTFYLTLLSLCEKWGFCHLPFGISIKLSTW